MATYILSRARTSLRKTLKPNPIPGSAVRTISRFPFLSQEPELVGQSFHPDDPEMAASSTPLPPNPASGNPFYQENWRRPLPNSPSLAPSRIPSGYVDQAPGGGMLYLSPTQDVNSLLNVFADWMTSHRWSDMKQCFELWIRKLDKNGKLNQPDVNLYNHYLRANFMMGASVGHMLDLLSRMEDYFLTPNTASFNIVFKAMRQAGETEAALKLLERMLQMGTESVPDDESYDLVIGILFSTDKIDVALKYIDVALKSGYMLSAKVFTECVRSCLLKGRSDTLISIIENCKKMDQNKALCPRWNLCVYLAEAAAKEENNKLAFYALEFMTTRMARGENERPPVTISIDEGLIVSVLGIAGRTYSSHLLDASWAILNQSLRQKKAPNPETYLAKIHAHSSLGNLQRAFSTLNEFESAYGNSGRDIDEDMFSPFTSLHPLVVACSKKGFETLDSVYFQLEKLSIADPPYKSVNALNCIILGCANIWDVDRAHQTFEAISSPFGLAPNIHSYNALLLAFGKIKKTSEASKVFDHLVSVGVRPNAMTYSLLVDAHLINRDPKSALSAMEDMINAGFVPTKEMLIRVRRRCRREMDYENHESVKLLARKFQIQLGSETRRAILFNLDYSVNY